MLAPGWQAFIATTSFGAGYTILICASLTTDYEIQDWYGAIAQCWCSHQLILFRHVTLMTISVALLATAFNTFAARRMPMFEGMILYLHIILWFGVSCTLYSHPRIRTDMNSSTFRPGSLHLKYPPLKSLANSKIGADGQLWAQQQCSANSPRLLPSRELTAPLIWQKRSASLCHAIGVPVLTTYTA